MKNIHAFTETTTTPPGYISINDNEGKLSVSVRTRGAQNVSFIELNRDQLEEMMSDIAEYLGVPLVAKEPPSFKEFDKTLPNRSETTEK